ncbi:MAG: hypothetical protein RLP44_24335 [Aggregatilineales bacterium]
MSIRPAWDNAEKTAVRFIYYGQWSWVDMDDAVREAQMLFESVKYPVQVIVDLRESAPVALHGQIEPARSFEFMPHADAYIVCVGNQELTRTFYQAISRMYHVKQGEARVKFTESLHKARQIIFQETMSERRYI